MTLRQLREASVKRLAHFRHPLRAWSAMEWGCAAGGEMGEMQNALKKLRRLEDGLDVPGDPKCREVAIGAIEKEIGDIIIYLDLVAARLDLPPLDYMVVSKFNETSAKIGSPIRLHHEEPDEIGDLKATTSSVRDPVACAQADAKDACKHEDKEFIRVTEDCMGNSGRQFRCRKCGIFSFTY